MCVTDFARTAREITEREKKKGRVKKERGTVAPCPRRADLSQQQLINPSHVFPLHVDQLHT